MNRDINQRNDDSGMQDNDIDDRDFQNGTNQEDPYELENDAA